MSKSKSRDFENSSTERSPQRKRRFSFSDLPIKRRLPISIGILLFGIFALLSFASYRAVRDSALEVGRERLLSLTQLLANQLQQQANNMGTRTATTANDAAIRAFLKSPTPTTRAAALTTLPGLAGTQDQSHLQIELWDANRSLLLTIPDGASAEPADLSSEFKQAGADPFKSVGSIRMMKDTLALPVVAAVKDDAGKPIGYVVRWRRLSTTPEARKQLTDMLGNQAVLYLGNIGDDIWTDMVKRVPKPPVPLNSTLELTQYVEGGTSVMALGRPIVGTPWFIVVEFPDKPLLAQANRFLRRIAIIGVALLALGITGAFLLSRNITRPLHSLTAAASAISAGDYSRTVDIRQADELGALASAFNTMVVTTRESQRDLEGKVQERKLTEQQLRRSEQQLAGVIDSAMDAIITVDNDQRIVLFNNAAETMFLFPAEDAIGQSLDRFIPERFRAAHKNHIQNFGKTHVTRRGMGALGALFGMRADGEEFPIEASISQIESDGRKLFTVILRDITERKRAEEALKEQTRILDLAPVMIRDLNGRILSWNAGVEQLFGWKAEEALAKISHKLLKTEFPRPLEEIKARLLAHGHWEGEVIHTRKDGERVVVASHWVLHRDEHDKPKAVLVVNNDITERKHAEREIRRLNEELEQRVADRTAQLQAANKELEAFSYSVSHDLRAPLRHINGFSQALLEDYADNLDKEGKHYLQEVRNASQEMAQLIDDVLQLARVTRSEMHREEVNLTELARAVIVDLKKTNGRRAIKINIEEGLTARGDKRLLRIVLANLLGNAWKFTSRRRQPEITFSSERHNGEVSYFVRDNGAGFDMSYVNKLFGAFQRLHTTGEFEGTGIGLATVQRIVARHGGRVWAEGKVNEGATFYFALPDFKEQGDEQQSDPTG